MQDEPIQFSGGGTLQGGTFSEASAAVESLTYLRRITHTFTAAVVILVLTTVAYLSLTGDFQTWHSRNELPSTALVVATIILSVWSAYWVTGRIFDASAKARPRRAPDFMMFKGLFRGLLGIAAVFGILAEVFELGLVLAAMGGMTGMFLGWSLRQPVSGFVAWVVVILKRPFRLGDRVFFPGLGLKGDVLDAGVMYVRLNQVGGMIGGEERTNREILVPNATLWDTVIINYTSELPGGRGLPSKYILDEVVSRITFDSNVEEAERIVLEAARKVTRDIIEETGVAPFVRGELYDYGIMIRVRFITIAMERVRISYEMSREIVKALNKSSHVDIAIPRIYSLRRTLGSPITRPESQA